MSTYDFPTNMDDESVDFHLRATTQNYNYEVERHRANSTRMYGNEKPVFVHVKILIPEFICPRCQDVWCDDSKPGMNVDYFGVVTDEDSTLVYLWVPTGSRMEWIKKKYVTSIEQYN